MPILNTKQFGFKAFSPKQLKVMNWWLDPKYKDKSTIICDGSVRAGKSLCMSLSFVLWAMTQFDGENFGFAGQSVSAVRRNVIATLLTVLDGWAGFTYKDHRAENRITISLGDRTNEFYLFGGKDESSYKQVQGLTVAGFFFDEVALQPENFVNQCLTRISRDDGKKWFNCNPAGSFHWFKTDFIDRIEQRNALHLHFMLDDNPALGDRTKNELKHQFTGVFYERYILGKWVQTDGLVYDSFNRETMVYDTPPAYDIDKYVCSCDYGIGNPTVFLLWGHSKVDNAWYLMKEYYHDGRHHTQRVTGYPPRQNVPPKSDVQYLMDLKAFLGPINCPIVIDPSAKSFIVTLTQNNIKAIPADNDVVTGIRVVNMRMNQGQIRFCKGLSAFYQELGSYAWDEKASIKGEDKVIKQHDHAMDAMRYFVMRILPPLVNEKESGFLAYDNY